jgi:hypothetical protein
MCFKAQGAPKKRRRKNRRTYLPIFLGDFWRFSGLILENLCCVFGLLMQRNGQKRDKKSRWGKDDRKQKKSQRFRPKVFDMDFPVVVASDDTVERVDLDPTASVLVPVFCLERLEVISYMS